MESIKVARALAGGALSQEYYSKIDLNLGFHEVAELKMVHIHSEVLAANEAVFYGLYRKSDVKDVVLTPETVALRDHNWLILGRHDTGAAAFTGTLGFDKEYQFPPGTILLNSPQVVARPAQATNNHVTMCLFYVIKEVGKAVLARLLMKYRNK